MSIYLRGQTWWCCITVPGRKPIQRSLKTRDKRAAQEAHDQLKAELWRVTQLKEQPRHTWQEAVVRWCQEKDHKKSMKTDLMHLRFLDGHYKGLKLDQIGIDQINAVRQARLDGGAKPATANRMLALVRAILNAARDEWEWLEKAPKIKLVPEPKRRVRWLTAEQVDRLMAELPEHLRLMAQFSLATGLRESNVTGLQWEQIDMQRKCAWIYADQAKAGKSIPVPLSDQACALIRAQLGKHHRYVFTYEGNPVGVANTRAWRNALKRAGITDFRWHDLRHTWASWHVQNGTPLHVLQELGGWESQDMVRRYAHLSSDHLRVYASNTDV